MTLYELNQAGYNSLPKISEEKLKIKKEEILDSWCNHGRYFILLCNELHYYTVFENNRLNSLDEGMIDTIFDLILSLGELKAVEINGPMIEFWISKDNKCHMYAFFNYDKGVIQL